MNDPEAMNADSSQSQPTPGRSRIWLVLVPTACALAAWIVSASGGVIWLLVGACLPVIGLIAVVVYGSRKSRLRALWPLVPFAAATVALLAAAIVLVATDDRFNELEAVSWYSTVWVVLFYSLVSLPFLAAFGGIWSRYELKGRTDA